MTESASLDSIQRWLQTVITHPEGVRAGVASSDAMTILDVAPATIETVINPSTEMTSLERLGIYGGAYFGRLLECLRVQYPTMRHAVGDEAFDGLAFGYLAEYPSTAYTLASLGDSFENYLRATRPPKAEEWDPDEPDFADFLIDLARLERVYGEVFNGPGPEQSRSLNASDFMGLTAEDFADSRLKLHGCVRLLEFQFPVHEYATSLRQGQTPIPQAARPICLLITRRDYVVRRYEITRTQFQLLTALAEDKTIGEAFESLLATTPDISLLDVQTWFRDWSAAPLFSDLLRASDEQE